MFNLFRRAYLSAKIRAWHFFSPSRRLAELQRLYVRTLVRNEPVRRFDKPVMEGLVLLSMTGARHLEYLAESLHSLCLTWSQIPAVKIVSDGSVDAAEIRNALGFYPSPVKVEMFADLQSRIAGRYGDSLARYAARHVLGRKLTVVLAHSLEPVPHLWSDADILWFQEPSAETLKKAKAMGLATTPDICASYDPGMVGLRPALPALPYFFNSGLVLTSRPVENSLAFDDLLKSAADKPHHFSEQTILASLAAQTGTPAWTLQEVHISFDDEHRIPLRALCAGQPWVARHYACALKQFWRDAIYLRREMPLK